MERAKSGSSDISQNNDRRKQIDTVKSVAGQLHAAAEIMERADNEIQKEGTQRKELAERVAQLIREGKTQDALRAISSQHFSGFRETKTFKGAKYELPLTEEEWVEILTVAQDAPSYVRIPLNMIHESDQRALRWEAFYERLRKEHVQEVDIQSAINNFFRNNQFPVRFVMHKDDRNQGVPRNSRIPHDEKRFAVYKRGRR